ncbi:hypothetical protein D1164_23635 [Mariniphaga sediminis]|uniref:Uncharacterized protein n=1 Tax=Mariniphaga sediminis TaxID=1628158 RepID=A0A399CSN0_9BACT|nr:hypothetical protein [Mariniphaga sediminis]RIH62687.1 hypothetical protein D1164_23635 [Mariniphaga sediminis]
MVDAWMKLHEYQKSRNGNPEKVQQKFEEKSNSPHKLEYARLEIMKFGWWNSANRKLPHINTSIYYPNEFERLLIDIECDCDEP